MNKRTPFPPKRVSRDGAKRRRRLAGFTLVEVVLIFFLLAIGLALLLPTMAKTGGGSRLRCVYNLKEIGLACRIYANDYGDKFPWEPTTNTTAVKVLEPYQYFQLVSNDLVAPKALVCPDDKSRQQSREFSTLRNTNISYFISLASADGRPQLWLAGDRVLTRQGRQLSAGLSFVKTNETLGWTREPHHDKGNIATSDGAAYQFDQSSLNKSFQENVLPVVRLLIP